MVQLGSGGTESRRRRRSRFIWIRGVLGWGLPVGLVWSLTMAWLMPFDGTFGRALGIYLLLLPVWLLAGYCWGAVMWKRVHRGAARPGVGEERQTATRDGQPE